MTVSIRLQDFDQFSLKTATHIIYDEIIPRCEANGIKLSCYGNHASKETICSVEKYDEEKKLFNIERIQRAFSCLGHITTRTYEAVGSYLLKHIIESYQDEYITNGDCIAAMLLKGYIAHFGSESPQLNCRFSLRPNG